MCQIMNPPPPLSLSLSHTRSHSLFHSFFRLCTSLFYVQILSGILSHQLAPNNYEHTVSQLSQIIKQSENSIIEQNNEVQSRVALYLSQLATFVRQSSVIIVNTVST